MCTDLKVNGSRPKIKKIKNPAPPFRHLSSLFFHHPSPLIIFTQSLILLMALVHPAKIPFKIKLHGNRPTCVTC